MTEMYSYKSPIISWLMEGDVSIQYQTLRDLVGEDRTELQSRIATEGWGANFLEKRNTDGHWGKKFYLPKWTSSHYTLLDLRNLYISPSVKPICETVDMIITNEKGPDGGINPSGIIAASDVCINGMLLNYATYFEASQKGLESIVDFILGELMEDGGFNCRSNRSGAVHSSLHSTLSVLEGFWEYQRNGYSYRLDEIKEAQKLSEEFILRHQLFLSDRTGEVIHKDFLKLSYPGRWRYNILKAMDYFQYSQAKWDARMLPPMKVLDSKRNKNGSWNLQAKHPGELHFEMEQAGKPSRWNTLRALRVFKRFEAEYRAALSAT